MATGLIDKLIIKDLKVVKDFNCYDLKPYFS